MKLKKLFASLAASTLVFTALASTAMTASAATEYDAQILIQTSSWSYRNAIQDDTYGNAGDGDWAGKLIAWRKDADDKDEAYDYGGENGITMEDVKITGNGEYSIKLNGDMTQNCESFNILGVSTNIPRTSEEGLDAQDIVISDIKVLIDGAEATIPGEGAAIIDGDQEDFINFQVANMWNDALGKVGFTPVNTKSIEIKFTVSGIGGSGDTSKDDTSKNDTSKDDTSKGNTGDDSSKTGLAGIAMVTVALAGASVVATKKRK